MNQAKRILNNLRLANSFYNSAAQLTRTRPLHTQVTRFSSHFTSRKPHTCINVNHNQRLFFSSKPEEFVHLMLSDNSSKNLQKELESSNLELTHESVMYVLMKLSKEPKKASIFFKWVVEKNGFEPSSSVYSLMLRIYANKDFIKQFWETIKEMKEEGYYIDEETYKTIFNIFRFAKLENDAVALRHFYNRLVKENANGDVVNKVVEVITREEEWKGELEKMKIEVSDNFVLRILKELRGKGYHLKAFTFFKWVNEGLGLKQSSVTYNGILRVLCREDSISEFWVIVKEMKNEGYDIDLDTYIKISRQFQKYKMLKDAVELYEHMMDSPFKPLDKECKLLLRAISTYNPPDLDLVFRVVNKYESAGNSLLKPVYDGIHRSLTSLGRFDEAEKIVETMRSIGCEPDNITYSQLVFGLCKAGKLDKACDVLDEMEIQECVPDIKTWTILIQGHCAANQADKALFLFTKMLEKNLDADADLLDVLVKGFLIQQRAGLAYKLLTELENKFQLRPWQATYKLLIQKILAERKFGEGLNLLGLMKRHGYPPFAEPFVQYVSRYGSVDDALDFLRVLTVKEYPSLSAYQHLFRGFLDEGRHSEANDLLFKCPHHIRKHQAITGLFGGSSNSGANVS